MVFSIFNWDRVFLVFFVAPNSVHSWNELEQKFHDHFCSGDNDVKLTDLTSIRQGRDESVFDYFK